MGRRCLAGTGLRVLCLVLWLGLGGAAQAKESALEEEPPPDSAKELKGPLQRAFEERIRVGVLFPRLRAFLDQQPPFLRDTQLTLHQRSYYFNRRNLDDTRSEALALGGSVAYESGWWRDFFSVGGEFFTSQRQHGPHDRPGTLLLQPVQGGYSVLGTAYARLKLREQVATLYRQELSLPYVNRQDSRMTPNTFEGYTLTGRLGDFEYIAGHLTDMKERNSDRFVSLSEAAGVLGSSHKGMSLAGLRYRLSEDFAIGAIDYRVKDVLNILYAEADYYRDLGTELGLRLGAQFTDQRSIGEDLLTGSAFDTRVVGARSALSYRGVILELAFSTTDAEARIRSPFGSYPGYLSLMQRDFDRAGEDAWGVFLSYDFKKLGLPGLTAVTSFARGSNAVDEDTGDPLPDQWEWDLTVDYRVSEGLLRGLWLRVRGSVVDERRRDKTRNELRVILNYEIPLL